MTTNGVALYEPAMEMLVSLERAGLLWADRTEPDGDCLIWIRAKTPAGYGKLSHGGRLLYAHRVAYEATRGQIPAGLTIDHLCRRPSCVNPDHLEAVTLRENIRRGEGFGGKQARRTHCPRGHELTGDNLYEWRGHRDCRTCRNANRKKHRQAAK